jgi:hypothetical protein
MAWGDLTEAQQQALISLYEHCDLTADELPYTPTFDRMHAAFVSSTQVPFTLHDLWRALSSARKAGLLPRKKR